MGRSSSLSSHTACPVAADQSFQVLSPEVVVQVLQAARLVLRNFKRQHRIGDRDISTFKMRGRIKIKKRLLEDRGTEGWEESW